MMLDWGLLRYWPVHLESITAIFLDLFSNFKVKQIHLNCSSLFNDFIKIKQASLMMSFSKNTLSQEI